MAGTEHREAAAAAGAKIPETKAAAEASKLASQAALPMGNAEVAAADATAKAADLKMVSPRRVQTRKRLVTAPVVLLTTMYQVKTRFFVSILLTGTLPSFASSTGDIDAVCVVDGFRRAVGPRRRQYA